jgi:uncharacterized protein with PQ loop repeat
MKSKDKTQKIGNLAGWAGMVLVQGSVLPPTINILMGHSDKVPPISMVLTIFLGLFLYLIRAIIQKDTLHIISNSIGFMTQGLLMTLIIFK